MSSIEERNFYRNRTLQVLEKWGIQGEMNQYNVRKAASSYARIKNKYQVMKWVSIGSICFLIALMGLMIGSVVLGIEASKDFTVKNSMLISGDKTLKTSEVVYTTKLKLTTPLSVIQGIKNLRIESTTKDGDKQYYEFQVVSFYYSSGRNLTLYGHTHMAQIKADGSVDITPVTVQNNARRFDSSLTKREESATVQTTSPTSTTTTTNNFIEITTCEEFRNLQPNGKYVLLSDINCGSTSYPPISSFGGIINGNMHTITINIDAQEGEGGIFSTLLSGTLITNVVVEGNITGTGICGSIAARSNPNVAIISANVYANVVCNANANGNVIAGGILGSLQNSNSQQGVAFIRTISQGQVQAVSSSPQNTIFGGLYGLATDPSYLVVYNGIVSGTFFSNLAQNQNSKRNDSTTDNPNDYKIHFIGYRTTTNVDLNTLVSKRIVVDVNNINSVCEDSDEGYQWYEDFFMAYYGILDGSATPEQVATYNNNVAICVNFFGRQYYEAVCCRGFGIKYDCWATFCPGSLVNNAPCMICRDKYFRDIQNTTIEEINGLPSQVFTDPKDAPKFIYSALQQNTCN